MSDNIIKIYSDPYQTAQAFGRYMVSVISHYTTHIALSGGSTPRILFEYLAENYAHSDIWEKVHFYWGDERCVAADDPESNYKMANDHLLGRIDIPRENIHRIHGENDPELERKRYAALLAGKLILTNGLPCFDLIILGLGDDGHTASIFPQQMHLLQSVNICDVARHPVSGQKRITVSGRTINNAREIIFLVTGENKKEKVHEIITQNANSQKYPAAHIKPSNGKISWFLDKAAAGLLKPT